MSTTTRQYDDLLQEFPRRPIRSDRQLARASRIASNVAVQPRLNDDQRDYLEVLSGLIERYEDEAHPIAMRSGTEMLLWRMEENALSPATLGKAIGMRLSTLNSQLKGERELTLEQVRALASYFRVSPAAFLTDVSASASRFVPVRGGSSSAFRLRRAIPGQVL